MHHWLERSNDQSACTYFAEENLGLNRLKVPAKTGLMMVGKPFEQNSSFSLPTDFL